VRRAAVRQAIGSPPFKPRSWSGARETAVEMERSFKAITPLKEEARALLCPLFFTLEEVFGKAG